MTHARPTSRPARRGGFSLLELLTVIGILLLLIGLAVIGFRTVGTSAKARATRTAMENCQNLLNEFELTTRINDLLLTPPVAANHWIAPPVVVPPAVQLPTDATGCSIIAQSVDLAATDQDSTNEGLLRQDTARVIARLRAVPKNRESLDKVTSNRVKGQHFAQLSAALPAGDAPILLDGSGNPIYFVPGGGLENVNIGYKGSGSRAAAVNYDKQNQTVVAPDRRPFWASPGPDGDLTTGDDNIYSFGE